MTSLMIHEIYGGGGSTAGLPNADYVVLYNASGTDQPLTGMALQLSNGGGGSGGNNNPFTVVALSGTVPAYGYFLIQVSAAGATGTALPTPDLIVDPAYSMGANNSRVALTSDTTQISNAAGGGTGPTIIDFVGVGTSANSWEGSGATTSPSNTLAVRRDSTGGWDTNSNSVDFSTGTPNPLNSSSTTDSTGAPTITTSNAASIDENATAVIIDVGATDPDGDTEGAGLTYSIVSAADNGGADGAAFTINSSTGELSFISSPDRETQGTYQVTVRVTDSARSAGDQLITVTVNDLDEFDIGSITDTNASNNAINENTIGAVGLTVQAIDADATNSTVTYSLVTDITGNTPYSGPFAVDNAGVVTLTQKLDYETDAHTHTIFVKATSTDGSSTVNSFDIALQNLSPERIVGTSSANTLAGGTDVDIVWGLAGNDQLTGAAGSDVLIGGHGRDIMTGGTGMDRFDFNYALEIGKGATRDVIKDFQNNWDKIDLLNIDANTRYAGNQAFKLLAGSGATFTGAGGELRFVKINAADDAYDRTIVEGDVNGDRIADFQIELTGLKNLTAGDFVL